MNTVIDALRSLPQVLLAAAVLVVAIRGFKRLEAKVGSVQVDVEQVGHTADAVNRSVNCVGDDQPTLRNVVVRVQQSLDEHIVETHQRLERIEDHLTQPRTTQKRR